MSRRRRNHYDVTNRVRISHPGEVGVAVCKILSKLYPRASLRPVRRAYATFAQLYAGTLPGYAGCDTWYHDAQHSLDCSLAVARLLDGYERSVPAAEQLGARRGLFAVILALFHDAGYIRRRGDAAANGAEYTLSHVQRSGEFLYEFLPTVGYAEEADLARRVVHFTGYEMPLDEVPVQDPKERMLGFIVASADLLAQTSDRCYLEKCRDYLFREFEVCGLAGTLPQDCECRQYPTAEALLENTPDFNRKLWEERLDGYFGSVHRYMAQHFGGRNPYLEQIEQNLALVTRLGRRHQLHKLSRRPQCVDAKHLRRLLGIKAAARKTRASSAQTSRAASPQL